MGMIDTALDLAQLATPSGGNLPAAGRDKAYFKSDDKFYGVNSAGTEVLIGPGGSGGAPITVWSTAPTYAVGDIVGYFGRLWKCTVSNTNKVPPMNTSYWQPITSMDVNAWYQVDPNFTGDQFNISWEPFWKNGTVTSALTTTAGEFETGKQALKVTMSATSNQRLYEKDENLVRGGETITVTVRAKLTAAPTGAAPLLDAQLLQNDMTAAPTPLASGLATTASDNPSQVLTTTWRTYTFNIVAVNAKPRAMVNITLTQDSSGSSIAVIDRVSVSRPGWNVGVPEQQMVGQVAMWGGTTNLPDGWLLCDGRAVDRVTYASLFAAIGTTHGVGDSISTFNLPNLTTRFALGAGSGGAGLVAAGTLGGTASHVHAAPDHYHPMAHTHNTGGPTQTIDRAGGGGTAASAAHGHVTTNPVDYGNTNWNSAGSGAQNTGAPDNGYPPYSAMYFIIRYAPPPAPAVIIANSPFTGAPSWVKEQVVAVATANVTISNPGTAVFDGITLVTNDRVLLPYQTTGGECGIYVFNGSAVAMTRATDSNTSAKVAGSEVSVARGTLFGGQRWTTAFKSTDTLGSTNQVWFRSMSTGEGTSTASTQVGVHGTAVPTSTQGSAVVLTAGKMTAICNVSGWRSDGAQRLVEVYFDGVLKGNMRLDASTTLNAHHTFTTLTWEQTVTAGTHYIYYRNVSANIDSDAASWKIDVMPQALAASVNTPLTPTDSGWINVPFAAGWSQYPGWDLCQYRKLNGITYLKGLCIGGTGTIFTLPAGFRPSGAGGGQHVITAANAAFALLNLYSDGRVVLNSGNPAWLTLQIPPFPADN